MTSHSAGVSRPGTAPQNNNLLNGVNTTKKQAQTRPLSPFSLKMQNSEPQQPVGQSRGGGPISTAKQHSQ